MVSYVHVSRIKVISIFIHILIDMIGDFVRNVNDCIVRWAPTTLSLEHDILSSGMAIHDMNLMEWKVTQVLPDTCIWKI